MTQPFVMFANAAVAYEGRASSTLERGNYLIVHKPDQSISVHGATMGRALNYQNSGSQVAFHKEGQEFTDLWQTMFSDKPEFLIWSQNKGEILAVAVYELIQTMSKLDGWSDNKPFLVKTEKDLVGKLVDNIYEYFRDYDIVVVETEVSTPYGKIDVVADTAEGVLLVIEVKRKIAGLSACSQLLRYTTHLEQFGKTLRPYIAAPKLSKTATEFMKQHEQNFLHLDFD